MRFTALIYFYGRRLRTRPVQEALAGLGVAIGVALVFAVQVANSSITGASSEIVQSVAGAANLQLRARDANGFDERIVDRARQLPGVAQVAPVLDQSATLRAPGSRSVSVDLASANVSLAVLDGLGRDLPAGGLTAGGIMLPTATARALGVSTTIGQAISKPLPVVTLDLRGRSAPVGVTAILGVDTVGAVSGAMAAVAPLGFIQRMAGLQGRVTRALIETRPGAQERVSRELEKLAAGRLTVAPADQDVSLLRQATIPNAEATGFFAFVSGLVGLLLAFNAMLLSAPERRRLIADLRIQGARPRDLVKLLLFQALCLGVVASLVGVMIGTLLSRGIFHETPGYLAAAFPLGTQTVIGWQPLLISFVGGVLVTCLAAAPPLLDLRRSRAVDAVYFEEGEPGHAMSSRPRVWFFVTGCALIVVSSIAPLLFGPVTAVAAIIGLALGALLTIPLCFTLVVSLAEAVAHIAGRFNMLLIATRALRATTVRSLALAATGAIAVFGSVAAQGAHRDLLNGLYHDYSQYVGSSDLWVTNPGDELATTNFVAGNLPARIAGLPAVASVRTYQGGFLDLSGRRIWVIARPPHARTMLPASQIVSGDLPTATRWLRDGGWITISQQIADLAHVKPGQTLTLPTPTGPVGYRVAATTTNLGWTSGAVVINESDYRRAWASANPSALEIDVRPWASPRAVKLAVERTLGPRSALRVQTSTGRASQADVLAREGLSRLSQISLLLMIAAALAMAAAMGASIWQRRASLASLRIQSFRPSQLRSILLCESSLVLGTGCVVGAVAGLYGHQLIDRYLRLVTGFPAPFSPGAPQMVQTILAITAAALVVLIVPGYAASRVPPGLALQE